MEEMHFREGIMKLRRLKVERLYGHYNYDVTFNSDVTFIYGSNGCGKTTILNITEAIITGQIYKLFSFDFTKILLEYIHDDASEALKQIVIYRNDDNLDITFENCKYHMMFSRENYVQSDFERAKYYFREYEVLNKIQETFNYVYLPLSRAFVAYDAFEEDLFVGYGKGQWFPAVKKSNKIQGDDLAMKQVETLIKRSCDNISRKISYINDEFRNKILKSSLDINMKDAEPRNLLDEIINLRENVNSIEETKTAYIKILKELSLINNKEEEHLVEFFNSVLGDVLAWRDKIPVEVVLKTYEVLKIKNLVSLAETMEEQKATIRKPIEIFVKTMNDFISGGEDGKEIEVNSNGDIWFTTYYGDSPISIHQLSSGEKQLITFFSNLIFKVKSNTSGIFVIDEPELSLHLYWQKIFVEKILDINKNVQLIFATHAPEIIGNNRNKAFKLKKKYVE